MKRIQLLTIAYIIFFAFFTSVVFAQNISGTFEGLRRQYDAKQENFVREFEYKYDLVQNGDIISGTSTIYNNKGEYAEVRLRGMVVGNTFYFEEYEIADQMTSESMVWCYKTGELKIEIKDDKIYLLGETKSYTSNYGMPCTGGYTELMKTSNTKIPDSNVSDSKLVEEINVSLYPNPTVAKATVSIELNSKNKINMKLYDLSGKLVSNLLDKTLEAGNHHVEIDMVNKTVGLYIVKINVGKEVFSRQLIKVGK